MNRTAYKLLILPLPAILATSAPAQYAIDSHVIAGGGTTSASPRYSVTGTIGQHDASTALQGTGYVIGGGFWHAVVQTPGAPDLTIRRNPFTGVVRVAWRDSDSIYQLQESSGPNALEAGSWSTIVGPYPVAGAVFVHEIALPTGSRFFRLAEITPP